MTYSAVVFSARHRKVLLRIVALTVTYFISWTPYTVVALLCTAGYTNPIDSLAVELPSTFAKTGALWNPLVYVVVNSTFRKKVKKVYFIYLLVC